LASTAAFDCTTATAAFTDKPKTLHHTYTNQKKAADKLNCQRKIAHHCGQSRHDTAALRAHQRAPEGASSSSQLPSLCASLPLRDKLIAGAAGAVRAAAIEGFSTGVGAAAMLLLLALLQLPVVVFETELNACE
jgi:hypothetical protein